MRKLSITEVLHATATIWLWLRLPESEISLVQVIKSSRALEALFEELKKALNNTQ